MREGWKEVRLGEVINTNNTNLGKNYHHTKIKYIDISSVGTGEILFNEEIEFSTAPSRAKRLVENGDTIISSVRPGNRNFAFIKNVADNVVVSTGFTTLHAKSEKINPRFLYYLISDNRFTDYLVSVEKGANYPAISPKDIEDAVVNFPPLETQRKIASILSGYDDLIENNLKRIKILEEMAQQTYEEWFVRMRFPGYETAVMNEETGLPEGWESLKLGDKIEVGRGSSPRPIADKKYFEGGTIPWLKIADATASKIYIYKTKEYVNDYGASFSRKLPIGSLILAASGTLGFPMFLGVEACIHDGWIYFKGVEDDLKEYFYFSFIGLKQYFDGIAYGAAIQNINTTILRESPLIVPDIDTLKNFKSIASGALDTIVNLQQQNQRLREARDVLLPRLMMGIVEV